MRRTVVASMLALALGVGACAGENLLSNTGFKERQNDGRPVGWLISKLDKEGAKGTAALAVVKETSPKESAAGEAENVDVIAFSIDGNCQWVHLSQTLRDVKITSGKTYRFSVWLRADKKAQVAVIIDMHAPKPEGGDKIPSRHKWTTYEVTSGWKLCTSELAADGKAPYNKFWPRLQLYTPDVKVHVFAPELVEVEK